MSKDMREVIARLCEDRGYMPYKENRFVFITDPKKRLRIYFMSPKVNTKSTVALVELTVVIKEEYTGSGWEEIGRKTFDSPMNCLKYNVDKLLDDVEEHFLLNRSQSREQKALRQEFEKIAKKHLFIDTLETQHSDSLDFHDVSVWGVEAALKAAYELGRNSKK